MSDDARRRGSPPSWESPHDRARELLGERFTETVDAADAAWLEEHLAGCAPCREVDAAYRADRRELRGLRVPEPPRDLWARTSAAIDAERQRRPRPIAAPVRAAGSPAGRRSAGLTPQVLLGLTAAVIGVFLVGSMLEPSVQPPDVALGSPLTPSGSSGLAGLATPIAIAAGDVAWSVRASDGTYSLQEAPVNQVCPTGATADCSPLDIHSQGVAAIPVTPTSVYASGAMHQFVVLGRQAGSDGVGLYVVSVGGPGSSASPSPAVRTPAPPSTPASASPSSGTSPSSAPSASPSASAVAPASPPASSTAVRLTGGDAVRVGQPGLSGAERVRLIERRERDAVSPCVGRSGVPATRHAGADSRSGHRHRLRPDGPRRHARRTRPTGPGSPSAPARPGTATGPTSTSGTPGRTVPSPPPPTTGRPSPAGREDGSSAAGSPLPRLRRRPTRRRSSRRPRSSLIRRPSTRRRSRPPPGDRSSTRPGPTSPTGPARSCRIPRPAVG